MVLDWSLLGTPRADALDGASIEVTGWVAPAELAEAHRFRRRGHSRLQPARHRRRCRARHL
jgi:hypothetical protein